MTLKVDQGISANKFFLIVQPKRQYPESRSGEPKPIVELTDPKTTEVVKAELYTWWPMNEKEFLTADAFCHLAYGYSAGILHRELKKKYPELQKEFAVEYWLLKRI